jgi:hypothetical protein
MGFGTQITGNEARPWLHRIPLHTGVHHGWTFTTTRVLGRLHRGRRGIKIPISKTVRVHL